MSLSSAFSAMKNDLERQERILYGIYLVLIHLGLFLLVVGSWGANANGKTTMKATAEDLCHMFPNIPESVCQDLKKMWKPYEEHVGNELKIDVNLGKKREMLPLATLATVGGIILLASGIGFISFCCKTPSILRVSTVGMLVSAIGLLVAIIASNVSHQMETVSVGLGEPIFTCICVYCLVLCIVQIVLGISVLRRLSTSHTRDVPSIDQRSVDQF